MKPVNQLTKLFFIIIFLFVLFLPLVQQLFHPFKISELFENRSRTNFPDGNVISKLVKKTESAKEYEKYFNDNYGFRDYLITSMTTIDYSVFNVSDNVVLGEDNWLEYKSVMEKDQISAERLTDEQFAEMENRFLELNKNLNKRGIKLIVVPVPNKNTIYPEYFEQVGVKRPVDTGFKKLNEFFKDHPEIGMVDATEILLKGKEKYKVFPKNDFHWTEVGAFLVAEEIINKVGEISGTGIKMNQPLRVSITDKAFRGGLNIALGVKKENLDDLVQVQKPWLEPEAQAKLKLEPKLPFSLLIGNSFSGAFRELPFYEKFEQLNWQHSDWMVTLYSHLRDWPQTKYIIFQYLETEVGYKFPNPSWWPSE